MTEEQEISWRILGRALGLAGTASANVVKSYAFPAIDAAIERWGRLKIRLLGGHSATAVALATGFGVMVGMNVVFVGAVAARAIIGG